ncbi:hypothetical protein AB9K26_02325 [Psychroserpens sp. XS_ASV72]|uniref:hypothetical protein n=1 Tax=Psychroserpens sp. XS_ASV72 TaxID=3241293 RepID=UPI0035158E92
MKAIRFFALLAVVSIFCFSCTPEQISEEIAPQGCCDEGEHIPPPPPPPPGG